MHAQSLLVHKIHTFNKLPRNQTPPGCRVSENRRRKLRARSQRVRSMRVNYKESSFTARFQACERYSYSVIIFFLLFRTRDRFLELARRRQFRLRVFVTVAQFRDGYFHITTAVFACDNLHVEKCVTTFNFIVFLVVALFTLIVSAVLLLFVVRPSARRANPFQAQPFRIRRGDDEFYSHVVRQQRFDQRKYLSF